MKNEIKRKQKISSGSLTLTYTPDNTFIPNKPSNPEIFLSMYSFKNWNKVALWNLANHLFKIGDRKISVL